MSSKNQSGSNTVKLNTIVPEPVVNPLDVAVPKTKISTPAISVPQGEMLKKAEFIDRAVERGDVKKRDAKPAIEAAIDNLDSFKNNLRDALIRISEITALLRQAIRDQRSNEREIQSVRQTLRSLQGVKI